MKKLYSKSEDKQNSYGGYFVSSSQPFRERFDVVNSVDGKGNRFPESDVPGFTEAVEMYQDGCKHLARFVLTLLARGIKIKDPNFFVDQHRGALFGETDSKSHLSSLFYHNIKVSEGQDKMLMAKHTDFTTITILNSSARGLQVI